MEVTAVVDPERALSAQPTALTSAESARASFETFVRAHTGSLLRTAYLLTGSGPAAEDLVQETFTRLYPKWAKVQAADQPVAYVRRALTNTFLNQRRSPSARTLIVEELPDTVDQRDLAVAVTERDLVWRLLATLPLRQRAVLVLRFFHDLPDSEIAIALDCREGTVRSLASRALAMLRDGTSRATLEGGHHG